MHAQGILDGLKAAHQALSGDDSGEMMGAADLLGSVVNELAESARLDESLAPLSERLSDLYYGARELATDLADRLYVMADGRTYLAQGEEDLVRYGYLTHL